MPTSLGALTIFGIVVAGAALFADSAVQYLVALILFLVLAFAGVNFWSNDRAPVTVKGWVLFALLWPAAGAVLFCIEMAIGKALNPSLDFVQAGLSTGMFGGAATAIGTLALTTISIGGLVRSLALAWQQGKSDLNNASESV